MREILLAFAAMAVIAVGASYGLHEVGLFSSEAQTTGGSVRLD